MKYLSILFLIPLMAFGQQTVQTDDIRIVNGDNYPKLEFTVTPGTQTNPFIVIGTQTNVIFQLPASGILGTAYGGTGTANGSIGNVTGTLTNNTTGNSLTSTYVTTSPLTNSTTGAAGSISGGFTTSINVLCPAGATWTTNQLRFSSGTLTNVVAVP